MQVQVSAWEEGRAGGSRSSIITMQIVGEGDAAGRLRNSSKLKYLLRLVNLGSRVTAGGMQVAGTLETGAYLITRNVVQSILVLLLDVVGVRIPSTQDPVALVLNMSILALMGDGSYVTILQWRK